MRTAGEAGTNDGHTPDEVGGPEAQAAITRAADAIRRADALLVAAGAGMGVDSGLPDFRGPEGFWRAYPPYRALGLRFEQMASPHTFARDAHLAWGFYGHRLNLYRWRGDLGIADLEPIFLEALEQHRIVGEAIDQPLGIVEPVGTDDQLPADEALLQAMRILGSSFRLLIAGHGEAEYVRSLQRKSAGLQVEFRGVVAAPEFICCFATMLITIARPIIIGKYRR